MHTHRRPYPPARRRKGVFETLERGSDRNGRQAARSRQLLVPARKRAARRRMSVRRMCVVPRLGWKARRQPRGAAQEVRRSREPRTAELALLLVSRTNSAGRFGQDGDMAARGADRDELERRGVTGPCPVEPEAVVATRLTSDPNGDSTSSLTVRPRMPTCLPGRVASSANAAMPNSTSSTATSNTEIGASPGAGTPGGTRAARGPPIPP